MYSVYEEGSKIESCMRMVHCTTKDTIHSVEIVPCGDHTISMHLDIYGQAYKGWSVVELVCMYSFSLVMLTLTVIDGRYST